MLSSRDLCSCSYTEFRLSSPSKSKPMKDRTRPKTELAVDDQLSLGNAGWHQTRGFSDCKWDQPALGSH